MKAAIRIRAVKALRAPQSAIEHTPREKEIDARGWLITWKLLLQADPLDIAARAA